MIAGEEIIINGNNYNYSVKVRKKQLDRLLIVFSRLYQRVL